MTEETITIYRKKYEQLLRDSLFLRALEEMGVDNWDWYGEALDRYQELLKDECT